MELLKNTQFLKLWGNQVLLQVAFNLTNLTALLLIDTLTSSRFALAQFYAAMTLPAFLVGIFAGSIVDFTNRKKIMLATDAILAILFLSYALVTGNYWALLGIAFAASSVAQFFAPAEAATIPQIVKGRQLENANALFLFTGLGAVVGGYALAGPIIDAFGGIENGGAKSAFILAGVLTAIGFILRSFLRDIQPPVKKIPKGKVLETSISMTRDAWKEAKADVRIYIPIILLTLVQFNVGVLSILFIDFVKTYLNLSATSMSLLLVLPLTLGLVLGTGILRLTDKIYKRGIIIDFSCMAFGFIILALGLSAAMFYGQSHGIGILRTITILCSVVVGIAAVLISVHSRTILQQRTPEQMLGRVFALVTIAASAVTPIPILLIALLTEKVDVATMFMAFGAFLIIIAWIMKPILTKKIS